MTISFILRLSLVIINIFSFSYFIGMFWILICRGSYILMIAEDERSIVDESDFFITAYDMLDMDIYR